MSRRSERDKRRHLRRAAELTADLWPQVQEGEAPHVSAVTRDVSTGGVSVRGQTDQIEVVDAAAAQALPVITRLSLPQSDRPLHAIARPKWIVHVDAEGAFDMGLQFEEITTRSRDALVAFILNDIASQEVAVSAPVLEKIQGIDDLATRIEEKMKEINRLLGSVVAGRDVLLEEVASLRQILLRLVQKP